jgi:hypothetical protein
LSEPSKSPHAISPPWSDKLAARYRCSLAPSLADWFDRELWQHFGQNEYREPIDPVSLLGQAPEVIWPVLMACDLLPLLSNTAGDWLCVRIDEHNVAAEIVQWYHGGGDWIPWGNDLAEAILFDALVAALPGGSRRHATPAEDPRPVRAAPCLGDDPLVLWALQRLSPALAELFDSSRSQAEVAEGLLQAGVAEVAVRCQLVLSALTQQTQESLGPLLRRDPDFNRNRLAQWVFDPGRIPTTQRERLEQQLGRSLDDMQDWAAAARHARHVTELAPELAWPWDIAGYAAERRGDLDAAKECYRRSAQCSVFTDQSIRLQTHWTAEQSAKFSAARLLAVSLEEVAASDYLRGLCDPDTERRRFRTTAYWTSRADQLAASGDHAGAHRCWMAAAWDVGAGPISVFAELLERIASSAERSGQSSRAELARTHRRCLQDRYGR